MKTLGATQEKVKSATNNGLWQSSYIAVGNGDWKNGGKGEVDQDLGGPQRKLKEEI